MLQILLAICLVAGCILGVFLYYQTREFAIVKAEEHIKDLLLNHQAVHTYITRHQKPAIYELKNQGRLYPAYFSPELLSSSYISQNLHRYYNEERKKIRLPEFYYKLAAKNPRNPLNTADAFEKELIERFNAGEIEDFKKVVNLDGQKFLYYALPFKRNAPTCMRCHGTPDAAPRELVDRYGPEKGFFEQLGETRAIISIRVPLQRELAEAAVFSSSSVAFTFASLVLFFAVGGTVLLGTITKQLETSVDERTRELNHTVKKLEENVSIRKRTEEALRQSEEHLRALFESSSDAIMTIDAERVITSANHAFFEQFGYGEADMIGRSPEVLHTSREMFLRFGQTVFPEVDRAGSWRGEWEFKRKDGSLLPMEIAVSALGFSGEPVSGYVGIMRDVTERRQAEEERIKTQKLESLGVLAGGIAHDFNNLLMAIWSNIGLAKTETDPVDPAVEYLEQGEEACKRARKLAQQLITFSRGGGPVKKATSVSKLFRDAIAFSLSGSQVSCEMDMPKDLWAAEVDEGQMNQVLNNLLLNAIQAMPEGGTVRIRAENVTLDGKSGVSQEPGTYIKCSVQDTGAGIREEHLPRIFDPYFTTKQTGSGLGLAVAYSIVKKHGGLMTAESELGKGTAFHVYLPSSKRMHADVEPSRTEMEKGSGRILLMDDEAIVRRPVGRILRRLGYEVELAKDGAEAIERYRVAFGSGNPFDAVILDLTVRGNIGGKKAAEELLKIDPRGRVIVSSGHSDDPVLSDWKEYGFSGVIPKPYDMKALSELLKTVLVEKR